MSSTRFQSLYRIVSVAGILLIFLQANALGVMYFLYHVNQDSIAITVCERKGTDCHGRCYLAKQQKNSEEHSSSQSSDRSSAITPLVVEYVHEETALTDPPLVEERAIVNTLTTSLSSGVTGQVFNPPRA